MVDKIKDIKIMCVDKDNKFKTIELKDLIILVLEFVKKKKVNK